MVPTRALECSLHGHRGEDWWTDLWVQLFFCAVIAFYRDPAPSFSFLNGWWKAWPKQRQPKTPVMHAQQRLLEKRIEAEPLR